MHNYEGHPCSSPDTVVEWLAFLEVTCPILGLEVGYTDIFVAFLSLQESVKKVS
jgi:hypothetical protein